MATAVLNEEALPKWWRLRLPERLPDLKGKWLARYTVVWAMMLAAAIVGPLRWAYVLSGNYAHPAWQPYGFATESPSGGIQVLTVFSSEALRAGMAPGDRILAIDGWAVPSGAAAMTLARPRIVKPEGSKSTFTFATPGKTPRTVRLTYARSHFESVYTRSGLTIVEYEWLSIASNVVGAFAFVASAVLLFVRERRKSVPAFLSLSFLIVAAAWGSNWSDLGVPNGLANVIGISGWALLIACLFALPSGRFAPHWSKWFVVLLPLLPLMPLLPDSRHIWLSALGFFLLAAATALMVRYWHLPSGAERQQLRWAFFGFVAGSAMLILDILGIVITDRLMLTDTRWFAWQAFVGWFGNVGIICFTVGLMTSILRYRLYDADSVIGRSAAYGVLTLGFIALFAGTEKLAEIIGERYFEHSIGIAAGAIGAAVAAACVVPLHNRVHSWAERRFQKPLIRLREGLPECLADLRDTATVAEIAEAVMRRVEAGVRSTREALLLADGGELALAAAHGIGTGEVEQWRSAWRAPAGEHALDGDRHDATFPLRLRLCIETADERETIGWLLLGPRPDDSFFGRDEREALEHVAGAIARAIHIAQLRERREADAEKRLSGLEKLIAGLLDKLGPGSFGTATA